MGLQRLFVGFSSAYSHVPEFAKNGCVSLRVPAGTSDVSRKNAVGGSGTHHAQHSLHSFPRLPALHDDALANLARHTLEVHVHREPSVSLEKARSKRITAEEKSQPFPAHGFSAEHVNPCSWLRVLLFACTVSVVCHLITLSVRCNSLFCGVR